MSPHHTIFWLCALATSAMANGSVDSTPLIIPAPRSDSSHALPDRPTVSVTLGQIAAVQKPTAPPAKEVPLHPLTEAERETIAACLILEAASQGDFGMRAVMSVIRNRANSQPQRFASTVLRPKQFSALNRVTSGQLTLWSAIQRAKRDRMWSTALAIVDDACLPTWHDSTEGATHYTRTDERAYWSRSLVRTTIIGAHSFYK